MTISPSEMIISVGEMLIVSISVARRKHNDVKELTQFIREVLILSMIMSLDFPRAISRPQFFGRAA